jgi:hypothetical protein
MSPPDRYLRIFDVKKYREIQPIVEGLDNQDVDPQQALALIQEVTNIVKGSEFQRYSNPNSIHDYLYYFQNGSNLIKENRLSEWDEEKNHGGSIINSIISCFCCPKYQYSDLSVPEVSGTMIDYTDVYGIFHRFDNKILDTLDFRSKDCPLERLPGDTWAGVFDPEKLSILTNITERKISILSRPNHILYGIHSEYSLNCFRISSKPPRSRDLEEGYFAVIHQDWQKELLVFYHDFHRLLKMAESHPSHTILNEVA